MGDAGREATDRFHLLRLAKFVLETHAIGDVLKNEEMIRSIAELEILGRDQNFASLAGGGANGRGQVANGVTGSELLGEVPSR